MCPCCDSPTATFLGCLGTLAHYRCRDCGADYSLADEDEPEDMEDDDHEPDIDEAQEWHDFDPDC